MDEQIKDGTINTDGVGAELDDMPPSALAEHHHYHHHHSHGHRHHRSRRYSHSKSNAKKKDCKLKKFFKKNRSIIVNIISCTVSVVLLIVIAFGFDKLFKPDDDKNAVVGVTQSTVTIESTVFSEEIPLVNQAILDYMSPSNKDSANDIYGDYQGYKNKLNVGTPISYTYRVKGLPKNTTVKSTTFCVADNKAMTDAKTCKFSGESISVYNLKTATKYYYSLDVTLSNGATVSTCGTFVTKRSPRILNIDGIVNVRDFGGWQVAGGATIKQGLLFRGSELDGVIEKDYCLTDKGLKIMKNDLGIRFDMDLRSPDNSNAKTKELENHFEHRYYSMAEYSGVFDSENHESVRKIFADLADKSNYPIYMHCTYGRDRTGTVCYLLGALLGMSEEDLAKEYELSAFTDSYVNTKDFIGLTTRLDILPGDSLSQKAEGYLLSIGVTAQEITNIKDIFLKQTKTLQ